MNYLVTHWYSEMLTAWTVFNFIVNGIAQSLDAPMAGASESYKFWFKFINYCALNIKRGSNGAPRVESSPNFVPAAEAYMKARLDAAGVVVPPPVPTIVPPKG